MWGKPKHKLTTLDIANKCPPVVQKNELLHQKEEPSVAAWLDVWLGTRWSEDRILVPTGLVFDDVWHDVVWFWHGFCMFFKWCWHSFGMILACVRHDFGIALAWFRRVFDMVWAWVGHVFVMICSCLAGMVLMYESGMVRRRFVNHLLRSVWAMRSRHPSCPWQHNF